MTEHSPAAAPPVDDGETTPAGATTHDAGVPRALARLMSGGWSGPDDGELSRPQAVAPYAAKRRATLASHFPGEVLVVPTGGLVRRANDTDFPFRAGSDYAWLVGDLEADGVCVLWPDRHVVHAPARSARGTTAEPADEPADETLAADEPPDEPSDEPSAAAMAFFADRRYGELWVGPRRGPAELAAAFAVEASPLADLAASLADTTLPIRVLRGVAPSVDALVGARDKADAELAQVLSELRLVKDDIEVAALEEAVAATVTGFGEVVAELGRAAGLPNGERWLEGTFWRRSRVDGNDVGYGSIVACGAHATTLHWVRDDGPVREGDLVLLDMGVESRSLYTADVTRTLPVSGRFTEPQRRVYDVVARAQQAGIAAVRPGADYLAPHRAAMRVCVEALLAWGLLDPAHTATVKEADPADPDGPQVEVAKTGIDALLADQLHRRWTLHGTSHHLGLDVHDCAHAREEHYRKGTLEAGMVITVEPGLYFQGDDMLAPAELRGIGVRIEDDVLVTTDGCRVLSAALPTEAGEVEAWVTRLRS